MAFALRCATAGLAVVLEDVMPSRLRAARAELASHGGVLAGGLRLAETVEEAVREADLAIDFVPDELESKLEIFSMLDRMAPPKTIFCTPTRALSISDLASCTYRPELCVAISAPEKRLLGDQVELIRGRATAPATTERVGAWLAELGIVWAPMEDEREPLFTVSRS